MAATPVPGHRATPAGGVLPQAASSGSISTNATITFPTATASFGTITCIAIMDSDVEGSGNVLFYGQVTTAKAIDTGDTFQISSGNLTVSLS